MLIGHNCWPVTVGSRWSGKVPSDWRFYHAAPKYPDQAKLDGAEPHRLMNSLWLHMWLHVDDIPLLDETGNVPTIRR